MCCLLVVLFFVAEISAHTILPQVPIAEGQMLHGRKLASMITECCIVEFRKINPLKSTPPWTPNNMVVPCVHST